MDLLKHPIRGCLLISKEQSGTKTLGNPLSSICLEYCDDTQSLLVGSISGALWKISGSIITTMGTSKDIMPTALKWKDGAAAFRDNLLDPEAKRDVTTRVEKYCKENGFKEIEYQHIFEAKIDIRRLYSCPNVFGYEYHSGPVTAIKSAPFQRNLFATCSADGSIRLYDQQQKGYLIQLQPTISAEVTCFDWSPLRPAAFIASCSSGEIFLYDISQNKSAPILKLQSQSNTGSTFVKFNSRLTSYMASGYENGSVRIYKMNKYYSIGRVRK